MKDEGHYVLVKHHYKRNMRTYYEGRILKSGHPTETTKLADAARFETAARAYLFGIQHKELHTYRAMRDDWFDKGYVEDDGFIHMWWNPNFGVSKNMGHYLKKATVTEMPSKEGNCVVQLPNWR